MKVLEVISEKISWKSAGSSIFLVFNSFVWYIFTYSLFSQLVDSIGNPQTELVLYSAYFISVAIAAIVGAKIFPRFRVKGLMAWIIFGVISTALLIAISPENFLASGSIAVLLGCSVGVGLPSCLSFFADITKIENRSFAGGVIWSLVGVFVLGFAFLFDVFNYFEMMILLVGWRVFGVVGFNLLNKNYEKPEVQEAPSYLELIQDKKTLLYLFPWVMFSIINFALAPIVENAVGDFFLTMQLFTWFLVGIFAIIGGYIADIVGRKRVVIAGFVMLGLEYAAMSIFLGSAITAYVFMILDGTTWGLLLSVFFMSLWGDLGQYHVKEKYYVLGGLPYLLANFLYILIKPQVLKIEASLAFTYASFFLFLAILPLIYAPETLPEKKIKERELKMYLENAQKIKNKYY